MSEPGGTPENDTSAPTRVGYCDTPAYCHDVAVAGNYVYVANGSSDLRIYQF